MRLRTLILVGLVLVLLPLLQTVQMPMVSAHGPTVTVIPFMATGYKYNVVNSGAGAGFEQPAFDDSSFSTGNAAFGTTFGCSSNTNGSVKTAWPVNTDILVRKQFTLPLGAHSLRVRGTVDNDATVYINGQQIGQVLSGFCNTPNINFTAPDSLLVAGTNLLAIRGHDYGGATYLDVKVEVHVASLDTTPPTLTVSCSPNLLWPPNHKLRDVTATPVASDAGSGIAAVVLTSVTSNEPDDGLGDGDTPGDIAGWSIGTLDTAGQLRAERSGTGTGRVYTITYTATDGAGNATSASCTVTVPHDQRR